MHGLLDGVRLEPERLAQLTVQDRVRQGAQNTYRARTMIDGDPRELYDVWWVNRRRLTISRGEVWATEPEVVVGGVSKDVAEREAARLKREADQAGYRNIRGEPYRFDVQPQDRNRLLEGGVGPLENQVPPPPGRSDGR